MLFRFAFCVFSLFFSLNAFAEILPATVIDGGTNQTTTSSVYQCWGFNKVSAHAVFSDSSTGTLEILVSDEESEPANTNNFVSLASANLGAGGTVLRASSVDLVAKWCAIKYTKATGTGTFSVYSTLLSN